MVPGYGDGMPLITFVKLAVLTVAGAQKKDERLTASLALSFFLVSEVANMWSPERRMKN